MIGARHNYIGLVSSGNLSNPLIIGSYNDPFDLLGFTHLIDDMHEHGLAGNIGNRFTGKAR